MKSSSRPRLDRRQVLKLLGAGFAVASLDLGRATAAPVTAVVSSSALDWTLPPLTFAYQALEPYLDAQTMELHHAKHHQAYLNNAKQLLAGHPELLARGPEGLVRDLGRVPEALRLGIRNHVGGHVNHAFFWKIIGPGQGASPPQLGGAIADTFGSMGEFKKQFADAALKRFGSGWVWLSLQHGALKIHSTANQDSPLSDGATPLLGLDVWEHAYYLHYQNRRAEYVAAFWHILNWTQAEKNYIAALTA